MESDFWMWRDAVDKNTFMLGVKSEYGTRASYTAWTTLFIDGIGDLFGKEFRDYCMDQPVGVPFNVHCALRSVE